MLVLTHRLAAGESLPSLAVPPLTLALTAEDRARSRHRFTTEEGRVVYLRLPRGTVLQHGDWLLPAGAMDDAWLDPRGNAGPISNTDHPRPASQPESRAPASQDVGPAVQVVAKPEPVLTVTADSLLALLQAAYHLGNRHVPLEITSQYLRLAPDPVLQAMLMHLGVTVRSELAPFLPTGGVYYHSH